MRFKNTKRHWGLVSIALHWSMAAMVFAMYSLGLYMTGLEYMHRWYEAAPHLHKSSGVVVFVLLCFRTFWTLTSSRPEPAPMPAWERKASAVVQGLFYFLLFGIAISGYLISTADGRAVEVFGLFEVPALISGIDRQEDIAGAVHLVLASFTIVLSGLHAMAALKHHFIDRDKTLPMMLGRN